MQDPLVVGTDMDNADGDGDPLWWVLLVTGSLWVLFALLVFRFNYTSVSAVSILLGTVVLCGALFEAVAAAGTHGWWRVAHIGLAIAFAVRGVPPEIMGIGPKVAIPAALAAAGISQDQLDWIELNEAFAAQALAVLAEWKLDPLDDRINPNGSGISLGHPIGATGARILATAAYEARRRQSRFVLETMCIGGGQGLAAVFEAIR